MSHYVPGMMSRQHQAVKGLRTEVFGGPITVIRKDGTTYQQPATYYDQVKKGGKGK